MDRENDNGYHSDSGEVQENTESIQTEDILLNDLNYDGDTTLYEPRFRELREERFERNIVAMKSLNHRIVHGLTTDIASEPLSVEEKGAVIIQKYARGFLARRSYLKLLMERFQKDEQIRKDRTMEQMDEAQLLVDNHCLEVQLEEYNIAKKNRAKRLICYAITIQRAWRKYLSTRDENRIQITRADP